jgi:hypothetical protein
MGQGDSRAMNQRTPLSPIAPATFDIRSPKLRCKRDARSIFGIGSRSRIDCAAVGFCSRPPPCDWLCLRGCRKAQQCHCSKWPASHTRVSSATRVVAIRNRSPTTISWQQGGARLDFRPTCARSACAWGQTTDRKRPSTSRLPLSMPRRTRRQRAVRGKAGSAAALLPSGSRTRLPA